MIQKITHVDEVLAPQIVALGRQFYAISGLTGEFHPDTFMEFWNKLLKAGIATMWIHVTNGVVTGSLGVILSMHPLDGKITAQEYFWFVDKDHRGTAGVRLFHAMMEWAKELKVERILVAHLDAIDIPVEKMYERTGFKKLETVYVW